MSTADRLIKGAQAQAKAYCPSDADTARAYEVGLLRALLREKCDELAIYTGDDRKRRDVATVYVGDVAVLVAYEFQRAEAPVYDVESPLVGPGHEAAVTVHEALVNGTWADPRDVFAEPIVELWEQTILERQMEAEL